MADILPIGDYHSMDDEGCVVNSSNIKTLPAKWKEVLDETVELFVKNVGKEKLESIVVRGSVARGNPMDRVSDVDTIAIAKGSGHELDMSWTKKVGVELCKKYPFATGFEFVVWDKDKVLDKKYVSRRFLLSSQAVTVWGTGLIVEIPPFKLDDSLARAMFGNLERDLSVFEEKIKDEKNKKRYCSWVCKRLLRNGFYLVMVREQKFTKDLYPSCKSFVKHYPEKEREMKHALKLAISPTEATRDIRDFVLTFGEWLAQEIQNY